jgi:DNA-binding MarR family transcriptional regulator
MGIDVNQVYIDAMPEMSEMNAIYLIGRADRIISAHLESALEGTNLSLAEFTALSVLNSRPGLSNARLARRSLVSPQAMHKVMRSLEGAGYVARTADPQGGRVLHAKVTPVGRRALKRILPRITEVEDRALSALTAKDRTELVRLLTLATTGG